MVGRKSRFVFFGKALILNSSLFVCNALKFRILFSILAVAVGHGKKRHKSGLSSIIMVIFVAGNVIVLQALAERSQW